MNRRQVLKGAAAAATVAVTPALPSEEIFYGGVADGSMIPITATEIIERQREFAEKYGKIGEQFTLEHLRRVKGFLESHAIRDEYVLVDSRDFDFS